MDGVLLANAAAEQGMVSESNDASIGMSREIRFEPDLFRRTGCASAEPLRVAVGIHGNDVPAAQVKTVIAFAGWAGLGSPILKVGRRGRLVVFVISEGRLGALSKFPPGCVVAILEVCGAAVLVGQIPCGENSSWDFFKQFGGGLRTGQILATGNVSRANQHKRLLFRRLLPGRLAVVLMHRRNSLRGIGSLCGD